MKKLFKKITLSLFFMATVASSSIFAGQPSCDNKVVFIEYAKIFFNYLSQSQNNIFSFGIGLDKLDDEKFKELLVAETENLDDIARLALEKLVHFIDFNESNHIKSLGIDVLQASWKYTHAVRHHLKDQKTLAANWRKAAKKLGRIFGKMADDSKIEKISEDIVDKQIELIYVYQLPPKHFSVDKVIALQNEILDKSIELAKHLVEGVCRSI